MIAAPATESSGTSAGLTAATDNRQVAIERRSLAGLPEAHAVAAHPGLIALIACDGGFGPRPDLLLSGVNRGANVGRAILHSGTVGAALTAGINGVRAIAVSLDVALSGAEDPHWPSATAVVGDLLPVVMDLASGTVLNVNVPGRPRRAALATYGRVQSRVNQLDDGTIEVTSVEVDGDLEPDTDAALLAEGHVTVTPLRSVSEDETLLP